MSLLGISIMIISLTGFLENVFKVSDTQLVSKDLMIVVFSLLIGSWIGDALHTDERLSRLSKGRKYSFNSFLDATFFFGIGGLQISGPIMLALNNDNSQLIIKSMVDFPFALMFGVCYGKVVSLSAIPVMILQIIIALLTYSARQFFSTALISQLCAFGYIVLFFTGFNLMSENKNKINNTNMLYGIIIILSYNLISYLWR